MLEKLVYGKEVSKFIIISDNGNICGNPVLFSFIKNHHIKNDVQLHLFLFEHSPKEISSLLNLDSGEILHDFYTDPARWDDDSSEGAINVNLFDSCMTIYGQKKHVIIIDSISPILRMFSGVAFFQSIHKLASNPHVSQTVALFHSHVHDINLGKRILHMADTVISFTSVAEKCCSMGVKLTAGRFGKETLISCVRHKKNNGKVIVSDEEFKISSDFCGLAVKEWLFTDAVTDTTGDAETDPFAVNSGSVSFKLNLTKTEQEQRSKLVMPYMKTSIDKSKPNIGTIFYEADEADLYEDDPDDDLDI